MDGARISGPEFKPTGSYSTTVPTTVLGALVRHGIYPDPYIGLNNMRIPDACDAFNQRYDLGKFSHLPDKANPWAKPYWFRKTFAVPADFAGKFVWLDLDGINYRADVWLNGRQIADATNTVGMFKRFKLDITSVVKPGAANVLAIAIHPLDHPGDPVEEQLKCLKGGFGPNSGDGEILRDVTQYSAAGWDWVAAVRDRNMGIWQDVYLNATGPVVVADPAAFTKVSISSTETNADVKLRLFASNASEKKQRAELFVTIRNPDRTATVATFKQAIELEPKSRQEIIFTSDNFPVLKLKNPSLWWPAHYGDQPLYDLEVTANVNGNPSSMASSRFGVREVSSYILPSGGRAFSVNGRPIRITGGAWVSDFLLSWSAQRYRDEVRLMAEGNATLVRMNGCAVMPPEVFLDACDEYGLLVWQDLSRTSASGDTSKRRWNPRPKDCDLKIYFDNITDFIARARGHSCILLWCGSNEAPAQDDLGQKLQDEVLPAMDDSRILIATSSTQPSWGKTPINTYSGGPWSMQRLTQYYGLYDTNQEFTSKNEIGLPSLPPLNSLAKAIPDFNEPWDEFFPLNLAMSYHDAVGGGNAQFRKYLEIMHEDIGQPSSIAEMLRWGDLYNNQVYRTIFEAGNRARPRNNLNTLWKSNAAWLSFMWQIFDWYLRPNAGYYTMKSALKPLHVQFSHIDEGVQVISTLAEDKPVKVAATVMTAEGKTVGSQSWDATIKADQSKSIGSLTKLLKNGPLYFVALDLLDAAGKQLDRTVTWTQHNTQWQELLQLPPVNLELRVVSSRDSGDEKIYELVVNNPSRVPAVNVMLELTDGAFGQEILPSFWSDNALTLLPGESKILQVRVRRAALPKFPCFVAEGLNVNPASWNTASGEVVKRQMHVAKLTISNDKGGAELHFTTQRLPSSDVRITTGPVALKLDGKLLRYVSVAASAGQEISGRIKLPPLSRGQHRIELGDVVILHIDSSTENSSP
jgi:exo-1,4-beta-D-glucosaminidase